MRDKNPASEAQNRSFVVVGLGPHLYALPIEHVVETMRALPIERVAGAPPFVLGVSVIRGTPVPVVNLASLVGRSSDGAARLVVLRIAERSVAVAVETVIGVRQWDARLTHEVPPLLGDTGPSILEALGTLDSQLLVVLRASRLLPHEIWNGPEAAA